MSPGSLGSSIVLPVMTPFEALMIMPVQPMHVALHQSIAQGTAVQNGCIICILLA